MSIGSASLNSNLKYLMLDPIILQAIDQIVQGAIIQNWRFYALVAATSLLAAMVGNLLASYARKRGETLATKADFDEILRQLRQSTKAAEDIKASVQHSDWISREWKVVRRTKLEELLDSAYAAEHWLEACRNRWMFQTTTELGPDPTDRVKRICALYFPELTAQAAALSAAQRAAISWNVSSGKRLLAAGPDVVAMQQILDSTLPTWSPHYQAVLQAISEVEAKATDLMAALRDS